MTNPNMRFAVSISLLTVLLTVSSMPSAFAGQRLKGGVQEQSQIQGQTSPGLSRGDLGGTPSNDDAFSGSEDQNQLAPPNFNVETALPPGPPPKKNFGLSAQDEGRGDAFDPQMMSAVPDQMLQKAPPRQMSTTTPNNFQNEEANPDMMLAWDAWHKRVAAAVYARYTALTNAAFMQSRRPLLASASYVVTRDGRITNAHLTQPSWNPVYNALVLGVINSISGDQAVLAFPPGSKRSMVEKSATFSQNYGHEGYKFTTGDRETVKQGR